MYSASGKGTGSVCVCVCVGGGDWEMNCGLPSLLSSG